MTLIAPTVVSQNTAVPTTLVTWDAMTYSDGAIANDGGSPVSLPDFADLTVTVEGTFSTGGSVTLKGSNDGGTTYHALTDPQGNAITKTAAAIEVVTETPLLIRPHVTAGDGSTAIDVRILFRRGAR
jgi:hypothetical protein